jgi:hypothetical protein
METTNNTLVAQEQQEMQLANNGNLMAFGSIQNFEVAKQMANCLASSSMVPQHYQGQKGVANCIIALEMANRIGTSPFMVMQNLYIVNGNPAWSSKFLIACVNMSGKFATPISYEWKGKEGTDEWGCRAYAVDRLGNVQRGAWVTLGLAKAEGWTAKNGSKWRTMPELMMQYRAGAFFQRAYAPEIAMGLMTAEEARDIKDVEYTEINKEEISKGVDMLTQALADKPKEEKQPNEQPKDTLFE